MSVISLSSYRPSARYDDEPWTEARIEQSATENGTFTALETITLSPVDADPTDPAYRNFTVEYDLEDGEWFRVVFVDDDADEEITAAVSVTQAQWRPTVDEVATLLRARTKPVDGQELIGTFTANTRPTAAQVEALIDGMSDDITSAFVNEIPEGSYADVRRAITLRTAQFIEISYFPEQTDDTANLFALYRVQAEAAKVALVNAANARAMFAETVAE